MDSILRVGFVGVKRSLCLAEAVRSCPRARIAAFCDVIEDRARKAAVDDGADWYTDYERMLDCAGLDAVVIATPMQLHADQSIAALDRNLHVLSEVTAAVDLDQARRLVQAGESSDAVYMMAENCCYTRPNMIVQRMVEAGLFGTPYYAEGEYLHDIRELSGETPWRRVWQTGVNGCTYGTHSLGPILDWFKGQRVVAVSCVGSGHHCRDSTGAPFIQEDTTLMLCRLSGGGLVKIRVDLLSERPVAPMNYCLQGTTGAYESSRAKGQADRLWLQNRIGSKEQWGTLAECEGDYLPECWKNPPDGPRASSHGGIDYLVTRDFVETVLGNKPCPIDLHRAMDMTLPGIISRESIARGGAWIDVPDSRDWGRSDFVSSHAGAAV